MQSQCSRRASDGMLVHCSYSRLWACLVWVVVHMHHNLHAKGRQAKALSDAPSRTRAGRYAYGKQVPAWAGQAIVRDRAGERTGIRFLPTGSCRWNCAARASHAFSAHHASVPKPRRQRNIFYDYDGRRSRRHPASQAAA